MKGIGDLFVIRVAGNILDSFGLGSIEYGLKHLGCKLVLVLGHTKCGAIHAALESDEDSFIGILTSRIKSQIGNTKDSIIASKNNVKAEIKYINEELISKDNSLNDVLIKGAIYHTQTGKVEIL